MTKSEKTGSNIFFKADTGGKIIADGSKFDNIDVDIFAEADTEGYISARNSIIEGKINTGAVSNNNAAIDLTNSQFKNISEKLSGLNSHQLAILLSDKLKESNVELVETIIKEVQNLKDVNALNFHLKRSPSLWEIVDRAGGIANIIQLAFTVAGFIKP